jgi:hypothetical protein
MPDCVRWIESDDIETTALRCIPVRCALRPPHHDLDVPLELGAQPALEHEQGDTVIAWVPGRSPSPRMPPRASIAGFQSVTQFR